MRSKNIRLLICVMLVTLSILTFALVACDKPAGEGGVNPNNHIVGDESNNTSNNGLKNYVDAKVEYINTQLTAHNLEGYQTNIVTYKNYNILNDALNYERDLLLGKELKEENKQKIKNDTELKKKNMNNIISKMRPEFIVYSKEVAGKTSYVIDLGLVYIPFNLFETYCNLYYAYLEPEYEKNYEAVIDSVKQELVNNVTLINGCVINTTVSSIISTNYEVYDFFDMKEEENGFVYKKGTNILIGYKGKDTDIVIPNRVKEIAERAFAFNQNLNSVKINSENCKSIGKNAFYGIVDLVVYYNGEPNNGDKFSWSESNTPLVVKYGGGYYNTGIYNSSNGMSYSRLAEKLYYTDMNMPDSEVSKRDIIKTNLQENGYSKVKIAVENRYVHPYTDLYIEQEAKANGWSTQDIDNVKNNINNFIYKTGTEYLAILDTITGKISICDSVMYKNDQFSTDQNQGECAIFNNEIFNDPNFNANDEVNKERYLNDKKYLYRADDFIIQVNKDYKDLDLKTIAKLSNDYHEEHISEWDNNEELVYGKLIIIGGYSFEEDFYQNIIMYAECEKEQLETYMSVIASNAFINCTNVKEFKFTSRVIGEELNFPGTKDIAIFTTKDTSIKYNNANHKIYNIVSDNENDIKDLYLYENGQKVEYKDKEDFNLQTMIQNNMTNNSLDNIYLNYYETNKDITFNEYCRPMFDTTPLYDIAINYIDLVSNIKQSVYVDALDQGQAYFAYSKAGGKAAAEYFLQASGRNIDNEILDGNVIIDGNYAIIYEDRFGSINKQYLFEQTLINKLLGKN